MSPPRGRAAESARVVENDPMTTEARRQVAGAELTEAIVEAALDELAESGYGRLSMAAVARRAGVPEEDLRGCWSSEREMTIAVVARLGVPLAEVPDTGTLRGDVRALLEAALRWLDHPRFGRLFPDLVAAAHRDEEVAEALRAHLGDPRRDRARVALEKAVERGEVPEGTDVELALDLFAAPLFWRLGVRRVPVDEGYLDSLAEELVRMLTSPPPPAEEG